jgi:tetratricopeptide (TPR) repeat protein
MLWWIGPQRKVFIDGRLEAYEESFWTETYEPIYFGEPLWERVFAQRDINAALVHYGYNMSRPKMLAHRLAEHKDWALVGWTEAALLYLRRIPVHEPVIGAREFKAIQPLAPNLDYITPLNAPAILAETERMHRNDEELPTSWVLTGRAYLVLGDYSRAAEAYERSLRTLLPSSLAQRDLAFAYVQLKRYKEAERLLLNLPRDDVNTRLLKQIEEAR